MRGDDRKDNLRRALKLIEGDVALPQRGTILVKPNFTSVIQSLAVTHVDAMHAVLEFVRERTPARILVAEGSGTGTRSADDGFRRFGYSSLVQYGVDFADLHADESFAVQVYDAGLKPLTVRVARSVVEADYRVSVCPPKTHDFVVVTAALKNIIMGSVQRKESEATKGLLVLARRVVPGFVRSLPFLHRVASQVGPLRGNDKMKMHQGYPAMNLNLYLVAKVVMPQLAVIDGFEGMEGNGPVDGTAVPLRVAIASTDAVAVDSVAAALMGFGISQIGYLTYCHQGGLGQGDLSQVEVLGEAVADCARRFRPHSTYQAQLDWHLPDVERYL